MQKLPYYYIGCFFDKEEEKRLLEHRQGPALEHRIGSLHVTVEYLPGQVDTSLFGTEVEAIVTGYGNNGRNEGFSVEVSSADEDMQRLLDSIELPHITLSRAEDAESVGTKKLRFDPIEPFSVKGKFGGYIRGHGPVTD